MGRKVHAKTCAEVYEGTDGAMKILLGGVPFGCNNVGDEAILECSVRLLKNLCPAAAITVSTNDPVQTRRLHKHMRVIRFSQPYSHRRMLHALSEHDVFVWWRDRSVGLPKPLRMMKLRNAPAEEHSFGMWA
jgi:hypothetical protein